MTSWQKTLKNRVQYLENENLKLNQQIAMLTRENVVLSRLANAPPTIMIACEKIVESAAQLTTSANELLKREGKK
jgi:hypothetical protein